MQIYDFFYSSKNKLIFLKIRGFQIIAGFKGKERTGHQNQLILPPTANQWMTFAEKLLLWYDHNKRDLPWRETSDPYRIWLSEIILQQTRIDQGLPYYQKFIKAFPSVEDLASSEEQDVLKLWQGLGYYSRARNLLATAREIVSAYGGKFPQNHEQLKQLKGIGDYTAAAIASISFGLPYPVADGNVVRFFSRHFKIEGPAGSGRVMNRVRTIAGEMILKHDPGKFNQAIMEFGALFCRPVDPPCSQCIFRKSCRAKREGLVDLLPLKTTKVQKRTRYFHYLIILPSDRDMTYLHKREGKDIWRNLFDFPLIETPSEVPPGELKKHPEWKQWFQGRRVNLLGISQPFTHHLTHQVVVARFIRVIVSPFPELSYKKIPVGDLESFPLPRLVEKFLLSSPFKLPTEK